MQQSTAFWYLFDFTIRKVGNTDIVLRHSLLKANNKRRGEKEAQFNCFDGSCIWDFGNARY